MPADISVRVKLPYPPKSAEFWFFLEHFCEGTRIVENWPQVALWALRSPNPPKSGLFCRDLNHFREGPRTLEN